MAYSSRLFFIVGLFLISNIAHATLLSFEDLDPSPSLFDSMPSPYNGFIFTNWFYGPDTLYKPASGVIDLFTDYADPNNPDARVITDNNAITAMTPFTFEGATFSGYSGVTFELYLGGNLVHTSMTLADAIGPDAYLPTVLSSGYGLAVDTVKVLGVQGYYSMDDFTYQAVTVAAIPEPSTYALMFAGLLAVGIAGWRRAG
jgi:PEP-CTERM motif